MQVFRSVLVPLDGSAFAEQALPLATELAQRAAAILQLATVHQALPLWAVSPEAPQFDPALEEEWRAREQAYLDDLVRRLKEKTQAPLSAALLTGPVSTALAEHIEATGTDLVVMTTHGRGPLNRFWLGSVADKLMRTLSVPILMIRPGPKPAPSSVRRILVPLDRSSFGEHILDPVIALGRLMKPKMTLFYVFEPIVPLMDPSTAITSGIETELNEANRRSAEVYLDAVAERLEDEGFEVDYRVGATSGAAQGILDQLDGGEFDLVALATHGAGGLHRALVGSVADKVVRGATCPVLVIHPKAETIGTAREAAAEQPAAAATASAMP